MRPCQVCCAARGHVGKSCRRLGVWVLWFLHVRPTNQPTPKDRDHFVKIIWTPLFYNELWLPRLRIAANSCLWNVSAHRSRLSPRLTNERDTTVCQMNLTFRPLCLWVCQNCVGRKQELYRVTKMQIFAFQNKGKSLTQNVRGLKWRRTRLAVVQVTGKR